MSRIFLSHSSLDNTAAVGLRDWLEGEGWKDEIFLDIDPVSGIAAGELWERKLNEAANRCEAVLFLVSKAWIASEWCRKEAILAHRLNKRMFGVLIEDLTVADVPKDLAGDWQLVRLASGRDGLTLRTVMPVTHKEEHVTFSREGLQRLKHGLEQAGLDPKYFSWPPASDPDRPPYRGLKPLEADDAGIFFGRDAPVVEALDQLRGLREAAPPRVLAILGASGAGKSSFLRAGLLPRLERDDRHFLPLPIVRPEREAISGETGLLRALEGAFQTAGIKTSRAGLRTAIDGGAATLRPLLQSLAAKKTPAALDQVTKPKPPTLILSIDQGEELFAADGQEEAQAFLALLRDLLTEDEPSLIALFTIRSDSYEQLQQAKQLDGIRKIPFDLGPMPKGSYVEVIKGPTLRLEKTPRALKVEDGLINALLIDIEDGGAKDALPLLAFTLERLYNEYGGDGHLTLAEYRTLGGIKGSIEAAVEQAFKMADKDPAIPRDRTERFNLLRRAMIPRLAVIDPDTKSPRRRVALQSEIPEKARPLIEYLVKQRLLAKDISKETGELTIEPAHEALLRQWSLLRGWLSDDSAYLILLDGVRRASQEWDANGRDAAWLAHTTIRLEAAERLLNERPDLAENFNPTDRDYISACRERDNARIEEAKAAQRRKRRLELAFAGILVLISCAGIAYATWTNFDYLRARWELLTDNSKLSIETEKNYAQMDVQPGKIAFRECARCPEMMVVPKGEFMMGPAEYEKRGRVGEPHEVTVAKNFAVGKFEVTFDEWKACVDARVCEEAYDQRWGREKRPVINVSWEEAKRFANWLSERIGKPGSYRLLTEAEWEYAARARTSTAYFWGDEIGIGNANCKECGDPWGDKTAPVGSFKANEFGLHDMHGNVYEWLEDCWTDNYNGAPTDGSARTNGDCSRHAGRGGSWASPHERLRSAFRDEDLAGFRSSSLGFRLARTLAP